jgi:isoquinoline 1-oxidoreductase alpha subunit
MISFSLNGERKIYQGDENKPLLWYVRDELQLTGAKFGCGQGVCGACTMHLNGEAVRTCTLPMAAVNGVEITTIEGIGSEAAKAVQDAWVALDVVQCGYCQPGQIMSAAALLNSNSSPNDEQINSAMRGNLCRCATYHRIRAAIHLAADSLAQEV